MYKERKSSYESLRKMKTCVDSGYRTLKTGGIAGIGVRPRSRFDTTVENNKQTNRI